MAELCFKMMWIDLTSRLKFKEVNVKSLSENKGWDEGEEKELLSIDCMPYPLHKIARLVMKTLRIRCWSHFIGEETEALRCSAFTLGHSGVLRSKLRLVRHVGVPSSQKFRRKETEL